MGNRPEGSLHETDLRTVLSHQFEGSAVDIVFVYCPACEPGTNILVPTWHKEAETLSEQKHKGGRLFFYKNEEWHRVQRTKYIFLFYFCMLNRDIFSLVSCFNRCF